MSQADVFIIESLDFDDEENQRFEGRIISDILSMSGKQCAYYYIRTKRELSTLLERFSSSSYRYLHLSCHGGGNSLHTTLDSIPYAEFGKMIVPHLKKRRLFISACSAATRTFADHIMPVSGCYSILGPAEDVYFSDAAVLWASFYHVMFRADSTAMKYDVIKAKAQEVANMYRVRLSLFDHNTHSAKPYRMKTIAPQKES